MVLNYYYVCKQVAQPVHLFLMIITKIKQLKEKKNVNFRNKWATRSCFFNIIKIEFLNL